MGNDNYKCGDLLNNGWLGNNQLTTKWLKISFHKDKILRNLETQTKGNACELVL